MAYTTYKLCTKPISSPPSGITFYICDTEGDRPSSGLSEGDQAWTKNTDKLWCADSATTWKEIGSSGGGGQDLATDTLWAAQGDLVKGTGNDTADILPIGAAATILGSDGSDPSWEPATGTGSPVRKTTPTFGTNITVPKVQGSTSIFGVLWLESTSSATKGYIYTGSNLMRFQSISTPILAPSATQTDIYSKSGLLNTRINVGTPIEYVLGAPMGFIFGLGQVGGFAPSGTTWNNGFYGLMADVTGTGTQSFDVTSAGRKIINTTGATSGNDAGWETPTIVERDALPYFAMMFSLDSVADCRMFIGWADQTLATMVGSDTPSGNYIGLSFSSARGDSNFRVISRAGNGQTNADTTVTADTAEHYFRIFNPSNTAWVYMVLDSDLVTEKAAVVSALSGPGATDELRFVAGIETRTNGAKVLNTFNGFFMLNK